MSIFLFVLGLIVGFGAKFAFDEYHYFKNQQVATIDKMESQLVRLEAIRLHGKKEKEFNDVL